MIGASDTELLNPLGFLDESDVFFSNEVSLGELQDGVGHQEDQALIRSLEAEAHCPLSGEGNGAGNGINS